MSWNVPSDWNSYYLACGCHESNGGCDCDDREFPVEDAERTWLAKAYLKVFRELPAGGDDG
jgi:hypothetical protein